MAVLIQRLVRAEAAGVAFTANPVTGNREETLVSAVRGVGERLVSGQASPDEWVVRGQQAEAQAAPEGAIDAAQALEIAALARRAQAQRGGAPQDIEWAIANGQLYLLQARPITTLPESAPEPVPVPIEPPPGSWQRDASHHPDPLYPMTRPIVDATEPFRQAFADFGFLLETVEWREIGGWVYFRMVPPGGKEGPAPPEGLMPLLIRVIPPLRQRIKQGVEAIRTDQPGRYAPRWYEEWQPELRARIASLRETDLATLSDADLDAYVGRLLELWWDAMDIPFKLIGTIGPMTAELAFMCRDLLGWDTRQVVDLLSGLSERSSEPSRRLAELARLAAERPRVRALLESGPITDATAERLAEVDPDFSAAFAAYQHEFGCRALRWELADPTLAECPGLVLSLIRDQVKSGYDPERDAAELARQRSAKRGAALAALAERAPAERARFERALARAELCYPIREDSEFYTASAPMALLRYVVLEIGRRLAQRGLLARRDDVFFLEPAEARAALRDGADQQALVRRRKGQRAWVLVHPGPATYGPPPGEPPSLKALPKESRFLMESLVWMLGEVIGPVESEPADQTDSASVRGLPASPGRYTGTVRVIMNETEFGKLQVGDVLVCPVTSPVWSVLFPNVGGVLSHPAIIAREYRVPAVVAAGNATQVLRDGQVVTVDGTTGTVEVGP